MTHSSKGFAFVEVFFFFKINVFVFLTGTFKQKLFGSTDIMSENRRAGKYMCICDCVSVFKLCQQSSYLTSIASLLVRKKCGRSFSGLFFVNVFLAFCVSN